MPVNSRDRMLVDHYFRGDMAAFERALDEGADPNAYASQDMYPHRILFEAIADGNAKAFRLLVEHGAALVDRKDGVTAAIMAAFFANYEILDCLFDRFNVKALDISIGTSTTPIVQAVIRRNFEMVDYLLKRGCSVETRNEDMWAHTPLEYAVGKGDVEMVRFLLERGADPRARGLCNIPALDRAEQDDIPNQTEILELLRMHLRP